LREVMREDQLFRLAGEQLTREDPESLAQAMERVGSGRCAIGN
jgi:hypothetical protein